MANVVSDKPKKVRCTCKRCGKRKMEPATIDRTEPYLCRGCDDKFILWQEAAVGSYDEDRRDLAAFLALKRR